VFRYGFCFSYIEKLKKEKIMQSNAISGQIQFKEIEDQTLLEALNELGRSINIFSTYGREHPAVAKTADSAAKAMHNLFINRDKLILGSFNGILTIDEVPVKATGTLQKSLERRLTWLNITGLRLSRGISEDELIQLAELLSCNEVETFETVLGQGALSHITSEKTVFQAVKEGEIVTSESELAGMPEDGVLVLEDDAFHPGTEQGNGPVKVDQIVAFLKGDIDIDDAEVGDSLTEHVGDPDRLGQMIMESVAIRQSASNLEGESLGDIVLGCLRRTYDGLRKQPAFKTTEGMADLRQALLLLEESMLTKMRNLTGEADPELDRQIVQTIREMDDSLGFEQAAQQYIEHQRGIENSKQMLQSFVQARGTSTAEQILEDTNFPPSDWRKIVVESGRSTDDAQPPIVDGINTLAMVFEKLENLMKSEDTDGNQVKDLLGQASENINGCMSSTKGKLDSLSKQIHEDDTGTIGGQGKGMSRKELLSSIAEVAQELMQPLTAINASLEMMLGGYAGHVTLEQQEMLGLAANSGEHLNFLMNELINIVGCPTNKGVDSRYHTTSDEVILMKK
jgi:hypothetical protein